MPSKRKLDPKNLYVSRDPTPLTNDQSGDTPSKNCNEVMGDETNASTSRVHEDSLYDAAAMAFHSSNESNDDNQASDREVDHNADEPHTCNLVGNKYF